MSLKLGATELGNNMDEPFIVHVGATLIRESRKLGDEFLEGTTRLVRAPGLGSFYALDPELWATRVTVPKPRKHPDQYVFGKKHAYKPAGSSALFVTVKESLYATDKGARGPLKPGVYGPFDSEGAALSEYFRARKKE